MISATTWVSKNAPREAGAAFRAWLRATYPRQAVEMLDDSAWAELYRAFLAAPVTR